MKRKLKLNAPLLNYKEGSIVTIDCDKGGTPLDIFWRRRVKDSKIDNCVQWVGEPHVGRPGVSKSDKSEKGSKEKTK